LKPAGRWIAIAGLVGAIGFVLTFAVLPAVLKGAGVAAPAATAMSFWLTALIAPIGFLVYSFIGFGFVSPPWMNLTLLHALLLTVGSLVNGVAWSGFAAIVIWARARDRWAFRLLLAVPILYWCGLALFFMKMRR
jgi:hypothetical protein